MKIAVRVIGLVDIGIEEELACFFIGPICWNLEFLLWVILNMFYDLLKRTVFAN